MKCNPRLILIALALLLAWPSTGGAKDSTLVVGEMWDITSIDPVSAGTTMAEKALVVESLVGVNEDMSLKPKLAESWVQKDDLTWQIKLRDNVYFHDGSKMTAEDVKFSLERANDENSQIKSLLKLKSIDVLDPRTLQIKTTDPNYILPAILHYASLGIISPKSIDSKGELEKPIGTGPFKQESFDPQTHILTVTKNDKWWGGEIKIDKIILKPIVDPNTRALSLENGEVDFTVDVPYNEVERISKMSGINVKIFENARTYLLSFNTKHAPLDDERVRKAITYAIDSDSIVNYVLFKAGKSANGVFRPDLYWANKDLVPYKFDLEKAKSLIAEAGWKDTNGDGIVEKDSKPLELSLIVLPNRPGLPPMAEAIAGQLKEIGIKVNVEVVESGVVTQRQKSGNWDMNIVAASLSMVPDPSYMLGAYFKTDGSSNYFGYSNAKVDSLLKEADSMSDQDMRLSDLNEVQSIVHDELPVVPVAYYAMVVAMKDYVKGYEFDPTSHDYMLNPGMYMEK